MGRKTKGTLLCSAHTKNGGTGNEGGVLRGACRRRDKLKQELLHRFQRVVVRRGRSRVQIEVACVFEWILRDLPRR